MTIIRQRKNLHQAIALGQLSIPHIFSRILSHERCYISATLLCYHSDSVITVQVQVALALVAPESQSFSRMATFLSSTGFCVCVGVFLCKKCKPTLPKRMVDYQLLDIK